MIKLAKFSLDVSVNHQEPRIRTIGCRIATVLESLLCQQRTKHCHTKNTLLRRIQVGLQVRLCAIVVLNPNTRLNLGSCTSSGMHSEAVCTRDVRKRLQF